MMRYIHPRTEPDFLAGRPHLTAKEEIISDVFFLPSHHLALEIHPPVFVEKSLWVFLLISLKNFPLDHHEPGSELFHLEGPLRFFLAFWRDRLAILILQVAYRPFANNERQHFGGHSGFDCLYHHVPIDRLLRILRPHDLAFRHLLHEMQKVKHVIRIKPDV